MKAIATISRTNEILKKFGLFAKKSYGQNFIIDPSVVEKIARVSHADKDGCIIEIGPGIGGLTEQLALLSKKVLAYEIDSRLIDVLDYSLAEYKNIEIIHQDFLKTDLKQKLVELRSEYKTIRVCANLPYYITTPILFKLFEYRDSIDSITVMMQKEVADRFKAEVNSSSYNALSIIVQYLYSVKQVMKIPKTIFNPQPSIDSAVVEFIPREIIDPVKNEEEFFLFVKACFKQRRKTLYNNLRAFTEDKELSLKIIVECDFKENARAQEIDIEGFKRLFSSYYER
jgi:16S rRNA (adenine1518-N6/adenine1519-N6)-dimethyltransferase